MGEAGTGGPARRIYLRTLCFVRDGDRVLLIRRSKPPNAGLYNAPGGKIEADEDPYEACLREVYEETGLRLAAARLRVLMTVITETTAAQWLLFVFTAERPAGDPDPIIDDEGDLRWVPIAEIETLPVVSDIPLMLPYLWSGEPGVLMAKIFTENDDADSMTGHELRMV